MTWFSIGSYRMPKENISDDMPKFKPSKKRKAKKRPNPEPVKTDTSGALEALKELKSNRLQKQDPAMTSYWIIVLYADIIQCLANPSPRATSTLVRDTAGANKTIKRIQKEIKESNGN